MYVRSLYVCINLCCSHVKSVRILILTLIRIYVCTRTPVAPSEPPQNINGTFINSTSIQVSWTPPPISSHNGIIRHYIIRYSEVNDDSSVQTMNTSDRSIEIGGLGKFTEYEVNVSAVTVREGPFNSIVVRTDSDGK